MKEKNLSSLRRILPLLQSLFLASYQRIFRLYAFYLDISIYRSCLALPNHRGFHLDLAGFGGTLDKNRSRTPFHLYRIGERFLIAYYPTLAFNSKQNVLVVETLDVALVVRNASNNGNHIRTIGMKGSALIIYPKLDSARSAGRLYLMSSHQFAIYISLSQQIGIRLLLLA